MTVRLLLALLAIICVACGSEPLTARCELGRSAACTCSSGAAGAQECGPSGVWSPCVCAAPDAAPVDVAAAADAPADTAPDVAQADAGSDIAVIDAPPIDASARPDVADAARADADRVDVAQDVGASDASGLPPFDHRSASVEVWLSINGEPPRSVVGTCTRARDTSGNVAVYVPSMVSPMAYAIIQPMTPSFSALVERCGDRSYPATGATFGISDEYSVAGIRLFNVSAVGMRSPTSACGSPGRIELYAFGCPIL
jgi:hypothetical protein